LVHTHPHGGFTHAPLSHRSGPHGHRPMTNVPFKPPPSTTSSVMKGMGQFFWVDVFLQNSFPPFSFSFFFTPPPFFLRVFVLRPEPAVVFPLVREISPPNFFDTPLVFNPSTCPNFLGGQFGTTGQAICSLPFGVLPCFGGWVHGLCPGWWCFPVSFFVLCFPSWDTKNFVSGPLDSGFFFPKTTPNFFLVFPSNLGAIFLPRNLQVKRCLDFFTVSHIFFFFFSFKKPGFFKGKDTFPFHLKFLPQRGPPQLVFCTHWEFAGVPQKWCGGCVGVFSRFFCRTSSRFPGLPRRELDPFSLPLISCPIPLFSLYSYQPPHRSRSKPTPPRGFLLLLGFASVKRGVALWVRISAVCLCTVLVAEPLLHREKSSFVVRRCFLKNLVDLGWVWGNFFPPSIIGSLFGLFCLELGAFDPLPPPRTQLLGNRLVLYTTR